MPRPSLFQQPLFRSLWIASLASNIGSWMQEVGAGWLMTSLAPSPLIVSLVQTASSLPMFLLALPAGALADVADRRKLLIAAQAWMAAAALILGILTGRGEVTPWTLVVLTFAMGCGGAVVGPAWQALVNEIVDHEDVPAAISMNAVGFNAARSVGPAVGGLIVSLGGPEATFLLNAVSFLAVLFVLWRWKRERIESALPGERMTAAMRAGLRYVRHAPELRAVMARTLSFVVGASCLWALLPLIARLELKTNAGGYGLLLAFFGAGAVTAGTLIQRIRARLPVERLIAVSTLLFAGVLLLMGMLRTMPSVSVAMFVGGMAWLSMLSSMNVAAQTVLPSWVRARALSIYLLVFFAGFAAGSTLWGFVATEWGFTAAFHAAAVTLLLGLPLTAGFRLHPGEGFNPASSRKWPAPALMETVPHDRGPALVTVEYRIDPAQAEGFRDAMREIHRIRKRDGAIRWGLWQDTEDPARFIESWVTESWLEHLRQHDRVQEGDLPPKEHAKSFHVGETPPQVRHYLFAYE